MDEQLKNSIDNIDYHRLLHKNVGGGIYLNEEQIEILDEHQIPYKTCKDIHELLYLLEQFEEDEEIEYILQEIAEFNYYHNTKK